MTYSYLVSAPIAFAAIIAASSSMVRATEIDLAQAVEGTDVLSYENYDGTCVLGFFCGIDGLCHEFSCDKWYQYGPRKFTGYLDNAFSPESLVCEDIPATQPGSDEVPHYSVDFRCLSQLNPSQVVNGMAFTIAMGFTRKCTANPSGTPATEFTCYELAASTDFGSFLAKVGSYGLECTDDEYTGPIYPKFEYDVVYTSYIKNETKTTNYTFLTSGFDATSELDVIHAAKGTMYSVYEEVNFQPPAAAPTASPTSGSVSYSKKRLPISVAVGAFLVSWLVMWSMF